MTRTALSGMPSRAASAERIGWGIWVECQNVSVSSPGSQLARQPRGSIGAWVWRPWWKRAVTIRSARGEGGVDVAVGEDAVIRAIGRDRLVDERQAGVLGALRIDDGRQRLVLDLDQRAGVLDLVAVLADHAGDRDRRRSGPCRWAGSASPSAAGRRSAARSGTGRPAERGRRRSARPRCPGACRAASASMRDDAGVGVRAADEGEVQHAAAGSDRRRRLPRPSTSLRVSRGLMRRADVPFGRLGHRTPPGDGRRPDCSERRRRSAMMGAGAQAIRARGDSWTAMPSATGIDTPAGGGYPVACRQRAC